MWSALAGGGSDLGFSLGQKEPTGGFQRNSSSPAVTLCEMQKVILNDGLMRSAGWLEMNHKEA